MQNLSLRRLVGGSDRLVAGTASPPTRRSSAGIPCPAPSSYEVDVTPYTAGSCNWTATGLVQWDNFTASTYWTPLGNSWNLVKPFNDAHHHIVAQEGITALTPGGNYCARVRAERSNDTQRPPDLRRLDLHRPERRQRLRLHVRGVSGRRQLHAVVLAGVPGLRRLPPSGQRIVEPADAALHVEPDLRQAELLRDRRDRSELPERRRLRVHEDPGVRAADEHDQRHDVSRHGVALLLGGAAGHGSRTAAVASATR